ncbi:response regulator transcription factor [Telluribacter sp.]|jgi:DNA-binding NarL/FixJ family response regulator|uniref:response regulator transcription factor n=1 Tax=Telluribacter sp. TaxID=1978767 RepID=UPI002E0E0AB7|nr:response regulator transcription factor [Telluribacter sp.]
MKKIRILLADDHRVLVESLAMLVSAMEGIEVAGIANNGTEALEMLEQLEVDVVLSDLHMPVMGGIDLANQISQKFPEVKVLLLTMDEEPEVIREAMRVGVKGYLLKNTSRHELEQAILTVMAGDQYFKEHILSRLNQLQTTDGTTESEAQDPVSILSSREIEVIRYIINEVPTAQIASEMFIAPSTVETHRRNIFKKLNIHSVVGLTRYALTHGLIDK